MEGDYTNYGVVSVNRDFSSLPTQLHSHTDPVTHFTDNISVIGITLFESVRYADASAPPTEAKGE